MFVFNNPKALGDLQKTQSNNQKTKGFVKEEKQKAAMKVKYQRWSKITKCKKK